MSKLNAKVARDLHALGLMHNCQREYKFHPSRKWLGDFCWVDDKIMLEVNGGTYLQGENRGAHSRGARQRKDYCKWSEASLLGWTVLLVDTVDVREGRHVELVLRAMGLA